MQKYCGCIYLKGWGIIDDVIEEYRKKYDEYKKILRKEVKIVVGARSAIFAPFTNIGIIIIDEEHDSSYKSETTPKYDVRDVATKIAEKAGIPDASGFSVFMALGLPNLL